MMGTTGTTETTTTEPAARTAGHKRTPSARTRILGWYVLLLAIALGAALIIQRSFLLDRMLADVDEGLDQEVAELQQLIDVGVDPETGEPFGGDLARIFETFLERNVPLEGEGIFTVLDGEPYLRDRTGNRFAGTPLVDVWTRVTEPVRGEEETELGTIRYLAVPTIFESETEGVFVVAILMDARLAQVDDVVRVGALVYGSIFVIASAVAWVAAGGVLRPLRLLDETAQSISETDLSQRIDVEGDDEVAALATTFNHMLDRLEEAFAAQRRFVDDAGHELRTPITVIRGQLELLGDNPDEREATVALVTAELDRMSRIVEDLLALAKAEQTDFIHLHPLDLAEFVTDLALKGSSLGERGIEVDEAQPAVVVADEQRLDQAMMNLVRNALEHTPPEAKIAIGGKVSGGELVLWVRDTGPGIPAAEREQIFQRFARGGGRRTASGAGLGLAIVKAITEGHGGRVELDSGPAGSTFTIRIPQGPEPQKAEA
jgi:two-component system, OmpR family, sensor kinase